MIFALVAVLLVVVVLFFAIIASLVFWFSNWSGKISREAWDVKDKINK